tara:strand:- start:12481 stop:13224 length:744 start_codon:yes stop_codon:yes gene_type:complete
MLPKKNKPKLSTARKTSMRLLLALLFLGMPIFAQAQFFIGAQQQISTNPAQYAFSGFNIRYSELRGRHRMGLDLSFRPSYCDGCPINGNSGIAGSYVDQNFFNYSYQSLTLGGSFDYILSNGNGFISAQPYFRYWWFTNKQLAYDNVEGYSFSGLRSESNRVLGIRLLIGGSRLFWDKEKTKGVIEISLGPGLMYRWIRFTTHQGLIGETMYMDYTEKNQGLVHPVFHVRLDFTLTFKKSVATPKPR